MGSKITETMITLTLYLILACIAIIEIPKISEMIHDLLFGQKKRKPPTDDADQDSDSKTVSNAKPTLVTSQQTLEISRISGISSKDGDIIKIQSFDQV